MRELSVSEQRYQAVLAVVSWYAFYVGLGIPLSAGILDGIL